MKRSLLAGIWVLLGVVLVLAVSIHEIALMGERGVDGRGERLNDRVAMLRDPAGRLGIADIRALEARGGFREATPRDLSVGYTTDAVWLAFRLENRGAGERYVVIGPPRLADVRVFAETEEGVFAETRTGQVVPVKARVIRSRQLVVPVGETSAPERRMFVRIRSDNAIQLDLRLWAPTDFHYNERDVDLRNGVQFGALFLFALYALIAGASSRERAFFHFGLTLLAYALYDMSILQYGLQFLWPGHPDWALRAPGVFLSLLVFSLGRVVASLLQTREHARFWDRLLLALSATALLCLPGMLWGNYAEWVQFVNHLSLGLLVVNIIAMVIAFRQGVAGAGLVLVAFLLLWVTSLVRVGQIIGLVPYQLFSSYSMGWSMVIGGLLMALTLGERVRRLRGEQERDRRRLVDAQIEARRQAELEVTERTRKLQVAKEVAEASNRAKSVFLAQLSHELRTPLHSILGYSSLMAGDAADSAAQRRLGAIRRSGRHLLALIDELLEYARGEAGHLQIERQPVDVREFLRSVVEETRELAHEHGAELVLHLGESLPSTAMVDNLRLRQVLINLIANACRHSGATRIALTADAAPAEGRGSLLALRVQDNGGGIPEAERDRIFLPFEQGSGGARKGLGLGLAISRQIATLMGGTLNLLPASPGSVFEVVLEAEQVEAPARARPSSPAALPRYSGPPRRLLVVDDIADNRELLCAMLEAFGFQTRAADSGGEALVCLEEGGIDAVLTDQLMPGMDGWALLREARQRGHAMPFVMVSAAVPHPPAEGEASPGFAALVMKPVEPARLAEVLGRALGVAWQALPATPVEREALVPPAAASLVALRQAAEQGFVSDIEDWVDRVLEEEPQARAFALVVRDAVRRLDLQGIVRMTASSSGTAHPA